MSEYFPKLKLLGENVKVDIDIYIIMQQNHI